jgi:hypothetical protein
VKRRCILLYHMLSWSYRLKVKLSERYTIASRRKGTSGAPSFSRWTGFKSTGDLFVFSCKCYAWRSVDYKSPEPRALKDLGNMCGTNLSRFKSGPVDLWGGG